MPIWKGPLAAEAAALAERLAKVAPESFDRALEGRLRRRALALLEALETYRRHPYRRALADPPELWSEGGSRLLDYGAGREGPPLLFVPSLINRGYILDLSERTSLLRWLAGRGFRPLLMDWGAPGAEEAGFTLTDYIAGRLERALAATLAACGRPPVVVGYCMGGLLALALAQRRPRDLSGLALLATPWDFAAEGGGQAAVARASLLAFSPLIDLYGVLPLDAVQSLFAALDPLGGARKFLMFGRLDPTSRRAEDFVALEDWLNDGVALAGPVARECLGGWYGANSTAEGAWRIAGQAVLPSRVELPSLAMIPAQDRIVPPASALSLARGLPRCTSLTPPVGHIGMVVSRQAPEAVWQPLARQLEGWFAAPPGAALRKSRRRG